MFDLADGLSWAVMTYRQKLRREKSVIRATMNPVWTAMLCYVVTVFRAILRRHANRLVCAVI